MDDFDLHPESLRRLLLLTEQEEAACSEYAQIAYRLAKFFEQRYLDLEQRRSEAASLLQRLYDVEELYGTQHN